VKSSLGYNQTVGYYFVAPSATPIGGINPSFRVYEVDSDTNVILDYKQYSINLTDINLHNTSSPL
jgi:hypothetical protein